MANSGDETAGKLPPLSEKGTESEASTPAPATDTEIRGSTAVSSILSRWEREDLIKRSGLVLRGLALLFALLSFLIMATNQHGGWMEFDHYDEYRYILGIAILACLYTACQVARDIHRLLTGKDIITRPSSFYVDFVGDQVMAYLLISACSAAIPLTNSMRKNVDNLFTDMSSASISMAFFAFTALAISALISGYKLTRQAYI
ncbi:hypothetical protein AMTRI_Chr08g165940 [Amborella trichopoda]|uniref:CASP-like protein n=1 Tax=Amborella trichopoda TaxID=13333 RepID=W1NJ75_AMBTC|nr:CASP-like protein 4B1 [Amborella trichopoda]ERM95573.1 hypothetical protein AMTR_s00023p00090030 [Amborella trichopoda]|eukprot:XP_006828157.1 CASP-like protein 4B1 [Amborella trichopoda]